jgi:DNA anti-recombination protein RmuC
MTICLPKGVIIPVDSKDLSINMSASTEAERSERLKKYASALRDEDEQMNTLASRDYAGQLPVAPDLTVLFLPSEPLLERRS